MKVACLDFCECSRVFHVQTFIEQFLALNEMKIREHLKNSLSVH